MASVTERLAALKAQGKSLSNSKEYAKLYNQSKGLSSSGGSSSLSGGSSGDFGSILKQAQQLQSQANNPILKSYEQSIPELRQSFATERTRLEGTKAPLKEKYSNLLNEIKGRQGTEEQSQTKVTNNELARRGILSQSGVGENEINSALSGVRQRYDPVVKEIGLEEAQGLSDIDSRISNLLSGETESVRNVRNAIAQLQAGGNTEALNLAQNLYSQNQARSMQEQQLKAQQEEQAYNRSLQERQFQLQQQAQRQKAATSDPLNNPILASLLNNLNGGGKTTTQTPPANNRNLLGLNDSNLDKALGKNASSKVNLGSLW